ncbi:uncharacterized protein LOC109709110 [Ananas comosus]|uniref:Uncharacterized protein LOC109709110 n=1 Tax=Ananas comosus TaxID=4615 RepID=A0A6P5ETA9_ANACO|nr:uncharacterized protein LOC109709110 [Ananas comosus]
MLMFRPPFFFLYDFFFYSQANHPPTWKDPQVKSFAQRKTDVVASGVLNSLLDRLRDRITSEFGQLMDVGTELKKLAGTLSAIRDVLEDAEARQVQEKALKGWLRRLKDVAYDIDDLLDEGLAKNRKRSLADPESSTASWMMGTVSNLLSLPDSFISQFKIGREIREIRERLDELAEERSKFHLQERSVVTCCRQENIAREETSSFVIESEVYGREEDKKKIIEFLLDRSGGDLGIIAIVGMGGLGKTTLAQLVYNDRQISDHFEKRIWVCVSDDFDHKRLVRSIIEHTTENACDLTSMASMQSKLKQELEKKRFLLVLDDVWNENYEKWDKFRTLLTIGATESKIIVTTRSSRVASVMATVEPHFLKTLSEDDCWLLFERRAFGIGACEKTANLVTIGKEIVKKCGGVPLAAKVLGSLMRSKRREKEWLAVRDNDSWKLEENGILPALRLSYNHLPSHLKQCFAYCSIFPKDTIIIIKDLIQLWIAEGFVRSLTESVELEDVGYQYIQELLSRSLFEEPRHVIGAVVIHDLVHDLAQFVSGEECSSIAKAVNRRDIYPSTRYSSFIYTIEIIPSVLEILNEVKKLRTFYFLKSHPFVQIGKEDMMLKILQTVFSSMKLLRALYLKYYPIKELPNSIGNLRHLRYLNLSYTNLEALPQSIGFLQNLHVLDMQGCRFLKELPDSIGNLSNILTLNLECCTSFVSLPNSIGHLKSLQTLNLAHTRIKKLPESLCCLSNLRSINIRHCFFLHELPENKKNTKSLTCLHPGHCHKLTRMPAGLTQPSYFRELLLFDLCEKSECGLKELNRLNLEGILLITSLENVKNVQQAREANLIEMDGLHSLGLAWDLDTYKKQMEAYVRTDVEGRSRQGLISALAVAEEVLDGLQPHENLTLLAIYRYPGKTFPKWLESSLPNLLELYLSFCFRCETLPKISQLHNLEILSLEKLPAIKSLPSLGQLPALKVLHLVALLAVKSLGSEFYGAGDGAFPVLENLSLEHMPELEEWCEASAGRRSFPRLSELRLLDCRKLKELPSSFPSVERLYLCANSKLLLSSLPHGAFPNLKIVHLANSYDLARPFVPRILAKHLTSVKCRDFYWWNPMHDDDLDFIRCIAELLYAEGASFAEPTENVTGLWKWANNLGEDGKSTKRTTLLAATWWVAWTDQNNLIFNDISPDPSRSLERVNRLITAWNELSGFHHHLIRFHCSKASEEALREEKLLAAMADIVSSSLLRLVFNKLGAQITKEFGLVMGVEKELTKLETTLAAIRHVLADAEAWQSQERALAGSLRRLKDAAFDADDVLDEVAAEALRRTSRGTKAVLGKLSSLPSSIMFQSRIARKVKKIGERLDEIADERSKFHLREGLVHDCKIENSARAETGSFVVESEVYGREEDKEMIVEFLLDMSSEVDPGVIGIVGLGGLGKTTLAQLVYNDRRVHGHFEEMIWVCVSDDFDSRRLIRSIVESVTGAKFDLTSMEPMQRSLMERLEGRRFLLVLDDVWNENSEKWDRLRTLLTAGGRGSKVVVTTQNVRVASLMGTVEPHILRGLSEDDCWLLFERRAFGLGAGAKTGNLVTIGKWIVKKAGGVPLAAKALGSLMRFKRRESEWLAIRDNDIWNLPDEENEILPALRLSYNHLPPRLKQCFAYCSIFAKDNSIDIDKLIQLWIAEGFVQSLDRRAELTDIGLRYVDELLSRSLFESYRRGSDGEVLSIKMHDLVHDLAQSVAGEECSIVDPSGTKRDIASTTRYSSFLCKNEPISSILEVLNKANKLRTLYLVAPHSRLMRLNKNEDDYNKILEVLQIIFSNMKLLRSLHLAHYPMKKLPVSVKNLRHLRYLNLSLTSLKNLPPSIGLLQNLQILNLASCRSLQALPETVGDLFNLYKLDLSGCSRLLSLPSSIGRLRSLQNLDLSISGIQKLPESVSCLSDLRSLGLRHCCFVRKLPENMKNMASLVHLDIYACYELTCMPSGIGQLSCLRTLPIFVAGGRNKCSLGELNRLNLKGRLDIRKLENVKNAEEAKEANLIGKQNLQSLHLSWDLNAYKKIIDECASNNNDEESMHKIMEAFLAQEWDTDSELAEKILEGLQPHQNLTVLEIEGFLGNTFPRWLLESTLPNLVELKLGTFVRSETLPELIQLHHLKILDLDNLLAIKRLPPLGQCPSLKVLSLSCLPEVECLGSEFYGGKGAFLALEKLTLSCMSKLEEWFGFAGQEFFPLLSDLRIESCPKLRALPSDFPSVKELSMCCDDQLLLSAFESGAFPNLDGLDIGNCTSLSKSSLPQVLIEHLRSNPGISLRMSASRLQRVV